MFEFENFRPSLVDSNLQGNSLFAEQADLVHQNIESLHKGLNQPTLQRYGDTDDRKGEPL